MATFNFSDFGFGRISEIIAALLKQYNVKSVSQIPTKDKVEALCYSVGLSIGELDSMIANNSPVLRSVKGHCFEVAFERLLAQNGYQVKDVGGDTDTDFEINGISLQLKTPNMAGTNDSRVQYKTHKTHGAKSVAESEEYLHTVSSFADYFVGLISYDPFKVYIIPKDKLPRWARNKQYIESPFTLPLPTSTLFDEKRVPEFKYINNYQQLNITINDSKVELSPQANEVLPLTSKAIGITSDIIVDSIMRSCNFRVWDMSIRGFTRETALERWLNKNGIKYSTQPALYRNVRTDKADIVLLQGKKPVFMQVKGLTLGGCQFNGLNTILDVESQLSRGRVNDDETQSRLYMITDFDYLGVVIDPLVNYKICKKMEWDYYAIPTSIIKRHPSFPRRVFSHQYLIYNKIQDYKLTPAKIKEICSV